MLSSATMTFTCEKGYAERAIANAVGGIPDLALHSRYALVPWN